MLVFFTQRWKQEAVIAWIGPDKYKAIVDHRGQWMRIEDSKNVDEH